jgi:hypothetical protein
VWFAKEKKWYVPPDKVDAAVFVVNNPHFYGEEDEESTTWYGRP